MNPSKPLFFFALGFAGLVCLPACTTLKSVQVAADPAMAQASVRVDVVPATPEIIAASVSEYWLPGNAVRATGNPKTVFFGPDKPSVQTVEVTSGSAKQVAVIADLPGSHADAPGDGDPRRKLIPAKGKGTKQSVKVLVSGGGLSVIPLK
jgi:protein-disulfide isomerase